MGLYYIDKECLSEGEETEESKVISRKKNSQIKFLDIYGQMFLKMIEKQYFTQKNITH